MSPPPKPKDPAYKRLVLFPLSLFYMATLWLSAWPPQLMLTSWLPRLQLAANHVLAQLAVLPAVNIFTGQTRDTTATLDTCFRISGYTASRERVVLYDSMPRCENHRRDVVKDNLVHFHDQHLGHALAELARPGAPLDRNRLPLSALFSIADYHCHRDPNHTFTHLVVTSRRQRRDLATGAVSDVVTVEGAHHCEDGAWEVIRAQKPAGAGADD